VEPIPIQEVAEFLAFRRDCATVGEFVEAVNEGLKAVEPSECGFSIVSMNMPVNTPEVPIRSGSQFNAVCHIRRVFRQILRGQAASGLS
jgi:hypothetical protein